MDETTSETPAAIGGPASPSQSKADKTKKTREYAKYVVWPLVASWRGIRRGFTFLDKHDGTVGAFAAVVIAVLTGFYVICSHAQWKVMSGQLTEMQNANKVASDSFAQTLSQMQAQTKAQQGAANAAKSAADTAAASLVLGERPWVKIKHRIVQPLTFNVDAWKGPVAKMVIEDTLENVGPTVALNVLSWEDVIPIDPDHSTRSARLRQSQWCDANRHPASNPAINMTGYMLFPKDPFVANSIVGAPMEEVIKAAAANSGGLTGKVGFVLVGCVCYRSAFEPQGGPTHQTRFIYYLGKWAESGAFNTYVLPSGIARELQLIEIPDGFSAD